MVSEVIGKQIHIADKIFPSSGCARDVGLTTEATFDADFAGHGRHLISEGGKRVGHVVDRFGEGSDFALCIDGQLLREDAVSDGSHNFNNAAHLLG